MMVEKEQKIKERTTAHHFILFVIPCKDVYCCTAALER